MTASLASLPPLRFFRISRHRRVAWIGSGVACLLSLIGLAICWFTPSIGAPLKPGLDFTGGTQIQIERACDPGACSAINGQEIQQRLARISLPSEAEEQAPNISSVAVQVLDQGQSVVLRLPALAPAQSAAVIEEMAADVGPLDQAGTSVNTIGPTLGAQLLQGSLISLLVSFAAIAAYITLRYDRVYAFLALLALGHDVLITCGVFAWLGLLQGIEVDSLFAVSLITVAGYSVTDTVVVFDRIREQKSLIGQFSLIDQVDVAVDATLTRSLYTSLTTLLPLLALIFFGGSSLFWFAVALTIGISVGSWSSIGIAPTLLPLLSR
ncbi:protein translocase subunit SecF [Synechococcus sp. CCY9201]|uniref:protein translocase subunit SecF n=1 Tax=unclassified Synechococcus TaxID=2626047 RepID=UPI002AD42963|nr:MULTISPECIES: protein translocase subunit SecF [unclassified Synechococcus]MEA5473113.1 protein translocase subunit SecF [Synechococcus sp. CCY9201]CAK6695445.1 Protein translocase subunit SecF [Synechococcus sp. CBW1107]